jgi:hypothetical protein
MRSGLHALRRSLLLSVNTQVAPLSGIPASVQQDHAQLREHFNHVAHCMESKNVDHITWQPGRPRCEPVNTLISLQPSLHDPPCSLTG